MPDKHVFCYLLNFFLRFDYFCVVNIRYHYLLFVREEYTYKITNSNQDNFLVFLHRRNYCCLFCLNETVLLLSPEWYLVARIFGRIDFLL